MIERPLRWVPSRAQVEARERALDGYVHERVERINERCGEHYRGRLDAALRRLRTQAGSPRAKVRELWRLADEFGRLTGDEVACRRGCAHCCHVAVGVPKHEAELIGELIGRKPADAAPRMSFDDVPWGYHNPCTFLRGTECSIYEHRPLACRTHFSVDTDDLLCRVDPPHSNHVPFLNTQPFDFTLVDITAARTGLPHYADIREWFPPEQP